jgi:hypothetical protein
MGQVQTVRGREKGQRVLKVRERPLLEMNGQSGSDSERRCKVDWKGKWICNSLCVCVTAKGVGR